MPSRRGRVATRPDCAVVVPSGPWYVLDGDDHPTGEETFINHDRLLAAYTFAMQSGVEVLVVSGRDSEKDDLDLAAFEARRRARWRPQVAAVEGLAPNTFVNAFRVLQHAWQHGYHELILVTSEWHMARALYVFAGINALCRRYLNWSVGLESHSAGWSERPTVREFEERLAAEEGKKLGWEGESLHNYGGQLARHRFPHRRGSFLPYPKTVDEVVPPPSLARLASRPLGR